MEFRKSSYCQMESCVEAGAEAWAASSYSFSNGNCVEAAGAQFAKAAASGTGSCVEAATAPFTRADASNPHGACVEASGATFAPAGASGGGNCVEAATAGFTRADASLPNSHCVEAGGATFTRADASAGGNCVEASTADFTSADASNYNGNCVEAAAGEYAKAADSWISNSVEADVHDHDGMVFVRDSKITPGADGNFPHLHFPARGWQSGRAVEFTPVPVAQVPLELREIAVSRDHDDDSSWYAVTSGSPQDDGTVLWFDQAEVDAWKLGVQNGEFTLDVHAAA